MFLNGVKESLRSCVKNCGHSLKNLLKWLLLGAAVGVLVGLVGSGFAHVLAFVNEFRTDHPMVVLGLPVGGLLIVWLYHVAHNTSDRGTNTVISSVHSSSDIPFRMTPLIFISTAITHLCGGSAGREGAAIQLGGSMCNYLGKAIELKPNERRVVIMCGMSAGFSALFGTPMAAAVFSLEVISIGIMHYSALVPCVTASLVSHFVAKLFQVPPESFPVPDVPSMDTLALVKIIVLAAAVAVVSILFCLVMHKTAALCKTYLKNSYLRVFIGGSLIILLSLALRTDAYLGSGMGIIEHVFHEGEASPWAFLLKILFTALTLGAGFKGGEIVPSFTVGAAFGCLLAAPLGIPVPLAAACGMIGVFCGVTNCPITSLLISFELFGFAGMPYYLVTAAVSFMLSGNYGLYHAQRLMYSKTETRYINDCAR